MKCGFSRCQSLSQHRGILRNHILFVTAFLRSEDNYCHVIPTALTLTDKQDLVKKAPEPQFSF